MLLRSAPPEAAAKSLLRGIVLSPLPRLSGGDDGVVLREDGADSVVGQRVLGEAVDQDWRTRAGVAEVDVDVWELDALVLPLVKGDEGGEGGIHGLVKEEEDEDG